MQVPLSARDLQIGSLSPAAPHLACLPAQLMSESTLTPLPSPTAVDLLWKQAGVLKKMLLCSWRKGVKEPALKPFRFVCASPVRIHY